MATNQRTAGIASGRLSVDEYSKNFADLHPPMAKHEALVESDRCYFCYDAPCMNACPTGIDIAMFIRQISTKNTPGAAKTIFEQNILGGMCARVCPTETLCEEACVRNTAEDQPVKIGELQRFATDHLIDKGVHPFERAAATGKKIAVVGAGPAGLACAHRLAMYGHDVTVFDAKEKAGGLNEYGLAAYKTVDNFAQREIEFLLGIGGIEIKNGVKLGSDIQLAELQSDYDAVFLGLGMGGTNTLRLDGEDMDGVIDAVDYIEDIRQAKDLSKLPVGRNVVVIGGGMTAVDIAVQTKRLGAENVTMVYRRGRENMNASDYEQELAASSGVLTRYWSAPVKLTGTGGKLTGITFEYMGTGSDGRLKGTGETFDLPADQVFKAIGQTFLPECIEGAGIALKNGRIVVGETRQTNLAGVWAGGDCVDGGDDLTVSSVEDGKVAAESIHKVLAAVGAETVGRQVNG